MRWHVFVLLFLPLVAAQAPLDGETNQLYIRSDGSLYLTHDSAADSESIEAAGGSNPTVDGERGWTVPLRDGLVAPVLLDPDGEVTFKASVGGGTGAGTFDLKFLLTDGGETVAEATVSDITYAGEYLPQTVTAPVQLSRLDGDSVLTITATGSAVQLFIDTDDDNGVILPITGVESVGGSPPRVYANLTSEVIGLDFDLNGTTWVYNWTAGAGNWTVNVTGNATNATLAIEGEGEGLNRTFDGVIDHQQPLAAGDWTIVVTGENGTIRLDITMETPEPPETEGNVTAPPTQGNETAPKARDSPLPLAWAMLALVAARFRR